MPTTETPLRWRTAHVVAFGALGVLLGTLGQNVGVSIDDLIAPPTLPVCHEDQVHGYIDGQGPVVCLTPGDPFVDYVPGVGWIAD